MPRLWDHLDLNELLITWGTNPDSDLDSDLECEFRSCVSGAIDLCRSQTLLLAVSCSQLFSRQGDPQIWKGNCEIEFLNKIELGVVIGSFSTAEWFHS